MNKREWQLKHKITDSKLSFITQIIQETNGQIVSIRPTPCKDGQPVPFADRGYIGEG